MGRLNPDAVPFVAPPMEERSLFMTFSYDCPMTQEELSNCFNRMGFGPCVEKVVIHEGPNGREAVSGYIVFKTSCLPRFILGTKDVVKILVNGDPVWFKKFIPRAERVNS